MISIKDNKTSKTVIFNDRQLLKISKDKPLIYLGVGNAKIKMNRGLFKIKDKPLYDEYYCTKEYIEKESLILDLESKDKKVSLVLTEKNNFLYIKLDGCDTKYDRVKLSLLSSCDEGFYGFGETFAAFNLKGKIVESFVEEHVAFSSIIKKIILSMFNLKTPMMKFEKYSTYMAQPTFITSNKAFFHIEPNAYTVFDLRDKDTFDVLMWNTKFEIILSTSQNYSDLMEGLTSIVGRQIELPEWIYNGVVLGIQDGTYVCDKKLKKMQEAGVKVSGIWSQDWSGQRITAFGKQVFWDWKFNKELYSSYSSYINEWNNKGVQFLAYINPFIAIEGELYKEAQIKGYLVMNKEGTPYLVTITTFPAAMVDFTNPDACTWIKNVIKNNMIDKGIRGWMADFGEYLPTDAVLFSGEDPIKVHNNWPVMWARLNNEAIKEAGKEGKILFFTRAGSTKTGEYSYLMWNGDQHVDWSRDYGIGSIVNSQLSLSASGIGMSHSDIGGYTTFGKIKRSKELMLRWLEMSAFSVVMRTHEGNKPDNNWQFDSDEDTVKAFKRFTTIYTKLSPYIKDLVKEASQTGMPVVRPLFFHYDDKNVYDIDDTYLLGPDLYVSPVVKKGQNKKEIYLPEDEWIHIFTGEIFNGGAHTISCPIGQIPVFYRAKSENRELFKEIKSIY